MTTIRSISQTGYNSDKIQTYRDASFVTGDSPVTHDVETDLGRVGYTGYVKNDGAGEFTIAIASHGTDYGDEIPLLKGETFPFDGHLVSKVRVTWVANSSYRIAVV